MIMLFTVLSLVLGEYLHAAERVQLQMAASADMGNVRGAVTDVESQFKASDKSPCSCASFLFVFKSLPDFKLWLCYLPDLHGRQPDFVAAGRNLLSLGLELQYYIGHCPPNHIAHIS